jgi:hypothetical protein
MHLNNARERAIALRPIKACEKRSLPRFQILDVFNKYVILSSDGRVVLQVMSAMISLFRKYRR